MISKIPCLSEVSMLISNSEGGCFPVTRLLTWGWGSPGGWVIPEERLNPEPGLFAPSAEGTEDAPWEEESWRESGEWMTSESVSGDSKVTRFFCWSKNFGTRSLKNIWSYESSLCWTLDSWVATLKFLKSSNLTWSSRVRRVIVQSWESDHPGGWRCACLRWYPFLAKFRMIFKTKLESATFAMGAETESEREHALRNERWVISEVCWTPSRLMSSLLIWPNTSWSEMPHVVRSTAWMLHQFHLHWRIVDQQVQSWWLWPDQLKSCEIVLPCLEIDDCKVGWSELAMTYLDQLALEVLEALNDLHIEELILRIHWLLWASLALWWRPDLLIDPEQWWHLTLKIRSLRLWAPWDSELLLELCRNYDPAE